MRKTLTVWLFCVAGERASDMLRPRDPGLLGVVVGGEVFQDLLHAVCQNLKAGKLHPRIDTGTLRAHLTHHVDLARISNKIKDDLKIFT